MFKELLARVVSGESLTREEARRAMKIIMDGEASPETNLRFFNSTAHEK